MWRCQNLRGQSKICQWCAGMGALWGHIVFWDFILLPGEYVKMPAMKAWWRKKCVFMCACVCSSCVCGGMVAQPRRCYKLQGRCMDDYLGHETEEILHFQTCCWPQRCVPLQQLFQRTHVDIIRHLGIVLLASTFTKTGERGKFSLEFS